MKKAQRTSLKGWPSKILVAMKLTIYLVVVAGLQVQANGYAQNMVTLSEKNSSLIKVFKQIKRQTGFSYVLTSDLLDQAHKINIEVRNVSLVYALDEIFRDQPLTYAIVGKTIVVKEKEEMKKVSVSSSLPNEIRGKVTTEEGEPIVGANIIVKGTNKIVTTDKNGEYVLMVDEGAVLEISYVGYEPKTVIIKDDHIINTSLAISAKELDVAIVQAYGMTTRRLNTGNINKISGAEISKQPVSNPLAALQGRVPGLLITQTSGYTSGEFRIELRGQNSLLQGSQPFFIIDGVPFNAGNDPLNQLSNAAFNVSPFYMIDPAEIESIEILKDADATSIYGSRGANGVILITTKSGKSGKTKFNANISTGISRITRFVDMMDTKQYLQMRKEAFQNDGTTPTSTTAPELVLWDTTRFIDLKKMFIGGTANTLDAQLSISGGNNNTQFLLGSGFHKESTVLPTDLFDSRVSVNSSLDHITFNRNFSIKFRATYSVLQNRLPFKDLTSVIIRPPNMRLYDSSGKLSWEEAGVPFRNLGLIQDGNPLSILESKYTAEHQNLIANLQLTYRLTSELALKTNFGYNSSASDETRIHPSTSLDPFSGTLPFSYFAEMDRNSWIFEPQLEYLKHIRKGRLNLLLGGTMQENEANGTTIDASNYTSDLLLRSISGAGSVTSRNSYSQYKYIAFFGRINYNINDKYIFNLTGRRDGSSRFGPANRFNNFGSSAFAWIFSNEKSIKNALPFLSFGKLRGSYGISGNDQIADYLFIDTWRINSSNYQQTPTLSPSGLFNPNLVWEANRKFEAAVDLGLFADRLMISVSYYKNRSNNQLILYDLPTQTGFTAVNRNFDALVQNKGLELQIQSKNIKTNRLTWETSFNITWSRNTLLEFPGLENSSYASDYVIGQPISIRKLLEYKGVDPNTGLYSFTDVDGNGMLNSIDRVILMNTSPKYFGGILNTLLFKNLVLDVFFEFKKQVGLNYLNTVNVGGGRYRNQPIIALDRWQKPGDNAANQRFTASTTTPAYQAAATYLPFSTGAYTDASFIRCKNISLSYSLPTRLVQLVKLQQTQFFFRAQNLFVITNYLGSDPENQNILKLPPLKTFVFGIQLGF